MSAKQKRILIVQSQAQVIVGDDGEIVTYYNPNTPRISAATIAGIIKEESPKSEIFFRDMALVNMLEPRSISKE